MARRWTDEELQDLIRLPKKDFAKKYNVSEGYVSTLKYRKKHILEGLQPEELNKDEAVPFRSIESLDDETLQRLLAIDGLLLARGMDISDLERASKVNAWNGFLKDKEGEAQKVTLAGVEMRPVLSEEEKLWQAEPANITPSRARPKKRDHKVLFVFSDLQVDYRRLPSGELEPVHDERAMRVARMICKDVQPDEIINLGDTIDLAELSRFDPESDHFYRTLAPSFQRVHDYYAELRADNPNAKITEVDSNHNARLGKFVLKYAQQFWGLQRANESESTYPVMSYPYLANLEHVGVDFVSGYESEYIYGQEYDTPPIVFKHGKMVRSNGSTASAEAKANPETHLVRGHGHRLEMHTRTNRQGDYLTYLQIGALCRITGEVPSYHSSVDVHGNVNHKQEDWQQTVLVVRDHNGHYEFDNIFIKDGKAFYQGREFSVE